MIKLYIGIFNDEDPVTTIGDNYFLLNSSKKFAEHYTKIQKRHMDLNYPEKSNEYKIYEVTIEKVKNDYEN